MTRLLGRPRCPRCNKKFDSKRGVTMHLAQPKVACKKNSTLRVVLSGSSDTEEESEDESPERRIFTGEDDGRNIIDENWDMPVNDDPYETVSPDAAHESSSSSTDSFHRDYFPEAGLRLGQGTSFLDAFWQDAFSEERRFNLFYPFASWGDWQFGSFLLQSDLSMASIDKLLALDFIRKLPISFRTAKELRSRAEILPQIPQWQTKTMTTQVPTRQPVKIHYRDPLLCLQFILSNPALKDKIEFCPYKLYTSAARLMRLYEEWMSAEAAWEMQTKLPPGTNLLGVVLSSDKTNISNQTGNRMAHPLLMSIANIQKKYRIKGNNQCFVLLALLPIAKFIHKNRRMRSLLQDRLTHEALDFILHPLKIAATVGVMMTDPAGFQRLCYPFLASYIVDTPEAQLLACVGGKTSPLTMANYQQFGDEFQHEPRTASTTLAKLSAADSLADPHDIIAYFRVASNLRLNGVHEPFWRNWFMADPYVFLTTEILHHLHRQFWDHDARWCIRTVGDIEIDFRFALLQVPVGYRLFSEGISKLKQVTGRIQREIQRYIISLISGAAPAGFVIAIRALLDFRYIVQAPRLSDMDCNRALKCLREFHDHKSTILDVGARVGKANRPINNWHIIKIELMQSIVPNLRFNGAPHQWSADVTERKHITEVKIPARSGNNQNYESQMCRFLDRRDKCKRFAAAIKAAGRELSHQADIDDVDQEISAEDEVDDDDLAELEGQPRRVVDYFDLSNRLGRGEFPRAPRPYRTMAIENTAIHLTRDPSTTRVGLDAIAINYALPDLKPAMADYIQRSNTETGRSQILRGRRTAAENCTLPFEFVQVWNKMWVQCKSFHYRSIVEPAQAIQALPQSDKWPYGRFDGALVNVDSSSIWPDSGLTGHCVVQVRLIFRPISGDSVGSFFAYVQRFDYVRHTLPGSNTSTIVDPVTGLVALKRAFRSNGSRFGDVVPLTAIRSPVHLTPKFGEKADTRLTSKLALEFSTDFWLNTYFTKEFFYSTRFRE